MEQPKPLDAKQWAMFCHLSAMTGVIIPFGNLIAPVVLWSLKKDEDAFINEQGKEVVNFQIFISICGIGLYLVATMMPFVFNGMALPTAGITGVVIFIFALVGGLKAKEGVSFKYPTPFKFL